MNKPELKDFYEALQVFFYSAWAMLYYAWQWTKKNGHRFVHLVWILVFGFVYSWTMIPVFMWIGAVPGIIYAILWAVWLRKFFDAA